MGVVGAEVKCGKSAQAVLACLNSQRMERKRGAEGGGGGGSQMPPAKHSRTSVGHTSPRSAGRGENSTKSAGTASNTEDTPTHVQEYQKAQLVELVGDLKKENKFLRDKVSEQNNLVAFLDASPRAAMYHMATVREDLTLTLARLGLPGNLPVENCPIAATLLNVEEITNKSLGDLPVHIKKLTAQLILALEKEHKTVDEEGKAARGKAGELHNRIRELSEQLEKYSEREKQMVVERSNLADELEDCRNENAMRRNRIVNLESTLRSNGQSGKGVLQNGVVDRFKHGGDAKSSHDSMKDPRDSSSSALASSVPNGVGTDSDLRASLKAERELSSARLKELKAVHEENKKLAANVEALKGDLAKRQSGVIPLDEVVASPIYQTMEATLSQVLLREKQWEAEKEHLNDELSNEKRRSQEELAMVKEESAQATKELKKQIQDLERVVDIVKAEKDKAAMSYEARKMESGTLTSVTAVYEKRLSMCEEMKKKLSEKNDSLQKKVESTKKQLEEVKTKWVDGAKSVSYSNNIQSSYRCADHCEQSDSAALIEQLQKDLADEKNTASSFCNEIEAVTTMYSDMEAENQRLVKLVAEKEQILSKVMGERLRARQQLTTAREENKALMVHRTASNERVKELTGALNAAKKVVNEAQMAQSAAVEESRKLSTNLERRRRIADEMTVKYRNADAESTERTKERDEYRARAEANAVAAEERRFIERRLKESIEELKREVQISKSAAQANGHNADHGERDEMIARLEKKLNCSIVTTERKSVVLTRCGHLFSKKCTDNLIATRNRKCPMCGKQFGLDDVLPVYF